MPSDRRRAAARRRAWGRGPIILRFEPLEGRQLLATTPVADLVPVAFDTLHNLDWGDNFNARGQIRNNGTAATTTPFHVNIYASPTSALGTGSALLGQVTIPAGLEPNQTVPFDQVVSLPSQPLGSVGQGGSVYVGILVDPEGYVPESNDLNNAGNGQGYDTSVVTITPHKPSILVGTSLGVYPDQATWGQTIRVSGQVLNDANGDAPPTRARIVLTPLGVTPGGVNDVTIGSIQVPAIQAHQSVAISQNVSLPAAPPYVFGNAQQFLLSVVQDADFVTNALSPHRATRGVGFDMAAMVIAPTATSANVQVARPDLTVAKVQAPTLPLIFGQSFQVTASIQNHGNLESGPFRVRFLLVGSNGTLDGALFLGDVTLDSLKAGFGQDLVQTINVPARLPDGVRLNSLAVGRIAVLVDPERVIDESDPTNNVGMSEVVSLRVVGADGTTTVPAVPVSSNTGSGTGTGTTTATTNRKATKLTPTTKQTTQTTPNQAGAAAAPTGARKRRLRAIPKHSAAHNLKVFPKHVSNYIKDLFR